MLYSLFALLIATKLLHLHQSQNRLCIFNSELWFMEWNHLRGSWWPSLFIYAYINDMTNKQQFNFSQNICTGTNKKSGTSLLLQGVTNEVYGIFVFRATIVAVLQFFSNENIIHMHSVIEKRFFLCTHPK